MKWRTVLCTALFLCGTVLLSACGGGEMPAPAEPPASSEVPAPSQPEEVPAPSESASGTGTAQTVGWHGRSGRL